MRTGGRKRIRAILYNTHPVYLPDEPTPLIENLIGSRYRPFSGRNWTGFDFFNRLGNEMSEDVFFIAWNRGAKYLCSALGRPLPRRFR
jgi:hypothetical protein